jgi:hypothetical protein
VKPPKPTEPKRSPKVVEIKAAGGTCVAYRRWLAALPMILAIFFVGSGFVARAQSKVDEYRLKAAFLFHFAQLVDWPPGALGADRDPVTLCTLGEDPFHGDLEAVVEGKLAGNRALHVRHFKLVQDVQGCHLLFIGSSERSLVPALLSKLKDAPVLTVGETDDFVKQGGVIRFCLEGNKVRFEINLDAAQRAGLKISSRLLLLAKSVVGNHG